MISHDHPLVAEVGQRVSSALADLESLFKPGVKLTFIARRPEKPDGSQDMVITNDRAVCPLISSEPWNWLRSKPAAMDQKTIIRVLRIIFAGCLPQGSNLVDVLRKVKWNSNGVMEADIQRGKEALGRQIMNEAAGMKDFPEEFFMNLPCFENVKFTQTVSVALEVLPDVQKFEVIPFPNQLQWALTKTLLSLQEQLSDSGVPTSIGAPSAGKSD